MKTGCKDRVLLGSLRIKHPRIRVVTPPFPAERSRSLLLPVPAPSHHTGMTSLTTAPSRPGSEESCRVAFVMTGNLYRNSRAIKQIRSLHDNGFVVEVWHLLGAGERVHFSNSVMIHDLSRPAGRGPLFFRQVDRLFGHELASVEADVFHASDLYALAACRRRADATGGGLTYDAREYYPHVAGTVGKPWARWWWRRMEREHIGRAEAVFTVSDSIADALSTDYGIDRPRVVHNAPPGSAAAPTAETRSLTERIGTSEPIILHLGQMKADRGCATLIMAMQQVSRAHLVFLGYGSGQKALEALARTSGLSSRVHFLEPVSPDAIRAVIRDAHIGVTLLEDTCLNHRYALPNKLFDYVHAGIPVLGADLDEVRRVITSFDIGMTADPKAPESVAASLRAMLDSGEQARWRTKLPRAAETFTWESASQRFIDGFMKATSRTSGADPDLTT